MTLRKLYLSVCLLFVAVFYMTAQDLEFPAIDPSPMDAAHYPPEAAYRNYLEGDAKNTRELIKVLYSRPQKKEREIFGGLVPYGQTWRLGANEGTEITFYGPVEINNTMINPGTYTVLADIYPEKWIIRLTTELGRAGHQNRDMSKEVLAATVPVTNVPNSREAFTIGFQKVNDNKCKLVVEWDRTRVSLPINLSPANLPPLDVSPMDLAQYPSMSRFRNFIENEEELAAAVAKVRVVYSRPQKKGRKVFGELIKYGSTWRFGANEASTITFFEDVKIGDKEVKAGTYGILAKINEGNWEFIIHKGIPSWGAFGHDDKNNVATFSASTERTSKEVEAFSMMFEEKDDNTVHLIAAWENTMARLPITLK